MNISVLNESAVKYRKELLLLIVIGLEEVLPHMTVRSGVQYKEVVGTMLGNYELRPHTGAVNKQDGLEVIKRTLRVYVGDVIAEESVEDLRKTIQGAALVGKAKQTNVHVLAKQIIALVIRSVSQKLAQCIFSAQRNDAGTTTAELFDGFDTITAAEIAAGNITSGKKNYLDVGEITAANAVEKLLGIFRSLSPEMKSRGNLKFFVPWSIKEFYDDDHLATFGPVPYNKEFEQTFIRGTSKKAQLVPLLGKEGSDFIHITTKSNMLIGVDQESDMEYVKAREVDNPFVTQFVMKAVFGTEFESIQKQDFCVARIGNSNSGQ